MPSCQLYNHFSYKNSYVVENIYIHTAYACAYNEVRDVDLAQKELLRELSKEGKNIDKEHKNIQTATFIAEKHLGPKSWHRNLPSLRRKFKGNIKTFEDRKGWWLNK